MVEPVHGALTEITWYDVLIIAMSMLSSTIIVMILYEPNMRRPINSV